MESAEEWVEWATDGGRPELDNGRFVTVAYGDTILIEQRPDSIAILAHKPRTVN